MGLHWFQTFFASGSGRCFITAGEALRLKELSAEWVRRALLNLAATYGGSWVEHALASHPGLLFHYFYADEPQSSDLALAESEIHGTGDAAASPTSGPVELCRGCGRMSRLIHNHRGWPRLHLHRVVLLVAAKVTGRRWTRRARTSHYPTRTDPSARRHLAQSNSPLGLSVDIIWADMPLSPLCPLRCRRQLDHRASEHFRCQDTRVDASRLAGSRPAEARRSQWRGISSPAHRTRRQAHVCSCLSRGYEPRRRVRRKPGPLMTAGIPSAFHVRRREPPPGSSRVIQHRVQFVRPGPEASLP